MKLLIILLLFPVLVFCQVTGSGGMSHDSLALKALFIQDPDSTTSVVLSNPRSNTLRVEAVGTEFLSRVSVGTQVGTTDGIDVVDQVSITNYHPTTKPILILAGADGAINVWTEQLVETFNDTIPPESGVFMMRGDTLSLSQRIDANPVFFDRYADTANSGTSQTLIYSAKIDAGRFSTIGDKIQVRYAGSFIGASLATKRILVILSDTPDLIGNQMIIFDKSVIISSTSSWSLYLSATLRKVTGDMFVRADATLNSDGLAVPAQTNYVEGDSDVMSAGNDAWIILAFQETGTGAGSGHITASVGTGWIWKAASPNH